MPQSLFEYQLHGIEKKLGHMIKQYGRKQVRLAVVEIARDITKNIVDEGRRILNDETNGTGRGAASLGIYDPTWLKGSNHNSSPSDSVWEELVSTKGVEINAGSNLEYLLYINYGFSQTDTRRVWIAREGRWVTVKPFTFAGLFFAERSIETIQSNPQMIQSIMMKRLALLVPRR